MFQILIVLAAFFLSTPSSGAIVSLVEVYAVDASCANLGAIQSLVVIANEGCTEWTPNELALDQKCLSIGEISFYNAMNFNPATSCLDIRMKLGTCVAGRSNRYMACCIEESAIVLGQTNCVSTTPAPVMPEVTPAPTMVDHVCKPEVGMNKKQCMRKMKLCAGTNPMKWAGKGCRIHGQVQHDGGCQRADFCGFTCAGACNRDATCQWRNNVCSNRVV